MKKSVKIICLLMLICFALTFLSVLHDKQQLSENMIRLHVIANSDSVEDQAVKLKVRDAIITYLTPRMSAVTNVKEAKKVIEENLDGLYTVARDMLTAEGMEDSVQVSLNREMYPIREYETFTLPSGVYNSLKVRIGDAAGKNWWCVVFPSLCMSAAGSEVAAASTFSDSLNHTIHNQNGYEVRFFILDWLGSLEKFFCDR